MNKKLIGKINKYLADTGVLYIKLHNLHWNVQGLQFKAVHEFLEDLYDDITEKMDEIAELLRMHGEYPAASLADFQKLSTVEELPSEAVEVKSALSITLDELKALDAIAKDIRSAADEEDAFDVVMMMEDHCADYQKTIWFISSMLD
ncbi:MAG: DNA starvation/stationary phase protection protein [Chloroflexota bacterium]|nr:DNA starvation/stationary phase protection protein [Chloroflexota bacterium]